MSEPTFGERYSQNAAENYERYFVPSIGRPVADTLVGHASLEPGERVLDVACGTGIVARLAAGRVGPEGEVEALDPNPGMLAVARAATDGAEAIVWHQAPAEKMPLPDERFDVVLCGMGLPFFADRQAAMEEMRRVAVPGGRVFANCPGPTPPPFQIMADLLARHVEAKLAGFVHAVFSLHDPGELRALAANSGFGDVEVVTERVPLRLPPPADFFWQYVHSTPLAAAVAPAPADLRRTLEREFSERCGEFVRDGGLSGAVGMTTLVARK